MRTNRSLNPTASHHGLLRGLDWRRDRWKAGLGQEVELKRVQPGAGSRSATLFWNWFWFGVCTGWLIVLLSGCAPSVSGQAADQREPHYVLGEHRVDAMDYRGAIRAFEESLEVDPHSAAAHFQLAWLYDAKVPDPAAAIYHYEQYLKLDPNAGNAALVKQRIEVCKEKLAEDVLGLPSMPAAQQRIEQLMTQIQQLKDANRQLRADLSRWSAYCSCLLATQTNLLVADAGRSASSQTANFNAVHSAPMITDTQPATIHADQPVRTVRNTAGGWRIHTVVAGETAVRIARNYGVSLQALLAANPGLEPRKMPVGLVLKIPPP